MKLGHSGMMGAALVATLAIGCGGRPTKAPEAPSSVSTTEVSAADLPHVGKAQQHVEPASERDSRDASESTPKDEPRRQVERKPGGGFTGYK